MTKLVRIENADTSEHKLFVEVYQFDSELLEYKLIEEHALLNPAQLLELYIWKDRYFRIIERE